MSAKPQIARVQCRRCDGLGYRLEFNPEWARQARKLAGKSLRSVAIEMGVSAAYLCDMELGRRAFTESMQQRFLEAIGESS